MIGSYFLAANTGRGFRSLYDSFPADRSAFLHIIKSGPGTGKSSFMRSIGKRAEEMGLEVEYVLCSGDPESLDGIYIPSLNTAWTDGTAPHSSEPEYFGVNGDYVNLGQFCRAPLSESDCGLVEMLTKRYREEYRRAYSYLSAALTLRRVSLMTPGENEQAHIEKRVNGLLPKGEKVLCRLDYVNRIFLRAFSCQGKIQLTEPITALCKLIYQFDSEHGADLTALRYTAEEAQRRGLRIVVCFSPLDAESIDAVLLPEQATAFVSSAWSLEPSRRIHLDRYLSPDVRNGARDELRRTRQPRNDCTQLALERLRAAKSLHDELEAVYREYIDFSALSDFTAQQLDSIFT